MFVGCTAVAEGWQAGGGGQAWAAQLCGVSGRRGSAPRDGLLIFGFYGTVKAIKARLVKVR